MHSVGYLALCSVSTSALVKGEICVSLKKKKNSSTQTRKEAAVGDLPTGSQGSCCLKATTPNLLTLCLKEEEKKKTDLSQVTGDGRYTKVRIRTGGRFLYIQKAKGLISDLIQWGGRRRDWSEYTQKF